MPAHFEDTGLFFWLPLPFFEINVWSDPDSNTPAITALPLEDGIQAPFPRMSSFMALPTLEIDYNEYAKSILELWTNQFLVTCYRIDCG